MFVVSNVNLLLLMLIAGGKWSSVMGLGVEFTWVLGLLVLSGLAWLLRDWRLLVLSFSAPSLLSLAMVWLLPESPRW